MIVSEDDDFVEDVLKVENDDAEKEEEKVEKPEGQGQRV